MYKMYNVYKMYKITGLRNSKIVGNQLPFEFDFKLMKRQYF